MTGAINYFDSAFAFVLRNEGTTFTNDPKDSGGPTKFGVTQKAYSSYVGRVVPVSVIENLTLEEAKLFYRKIYWDALKCGYLVDAGIAIAIFDTGVLYGPVTAAWLAQQAATLCKEELTVDGFIGLKSVAALNRLKRNRFLDFFTYLIKQRIIKVVYDNPKNERFREGWLKRADRLLTLNTGTAFNIITTA